MKEFLATRIDPDEEAGDNMEEKEDEWVIEEKAEDEEKIEENKENEFLLPDTFLSPPLGDIAVGWICRHNL